MNLFADLRRRRERTGRPIQVAVVGTGFFGSGLLRRLARIDGLHPALAANRTLERAVSALCAAGVDPGAICVCDDPLAAQAALERGQSVATSRLDRAAHTAAIDVIMETTGDVLVGAEVALEAIQHAKHVVAANTETQATVGPVLKQLADAAGVVYSDIAGDEPGDIKGLYDFCVGLGFAPVVAGNCKGVLKRYATPATQAEFAARARLKPWIASAAADGTKLCLEMTTVANATGMPPAVRGMLGPQTSTATLLSDFERLGLLDRGPIVEYTLGIPKGTFLVFRCDEPVERADLQYVKLGDGPHYLLYRHHVLIHYEAPLSAAEAVLYGTATIAPQGAPVAEAASFAKRDLRAGQLLDGIGGFDLYGLIVRADEAQRERLLPIGLASYARLRRDIARDEPIPLDAVEFEASNTVLELRQRQDRLVAATAVAR